MDILSNLKYVKGSRKNRKRVGRGEGSTRGGTSTGEVTDRCPGQALKEKPGSKAGRCLCKEEFQNLGSLIFLKFISSW